MAKRYCHHLYAAKTDRRLKAIVGVSCKHERVSIPDRPGFELFRLSSWEVSSAVLDSMGAWQIANRDSSELGAFWQGLERVGKHGGDVLIVSLDAALDWTLLGFWEEMERGTISICQRNTSSSGPDTDTVSEVSQERDSGNRNSRVRNNARMRSVQDGILSIEGSPAIAHFRRNRSTARYRWVSITNYGIPTDKVVSPGTSISHNLVRIIIDMDESLHSRSLGGLMDTSSSQAFYSYRRKHLRSMVLCHTENDVLEMESASNYGGRCEAYHIGHYPERVYELDMRGAYVWAMLHTPVACRLVNYNLEPASGEMPGELLPDTICAVVTIETDRPDYPYRNEHGTVYPVGRFRTTLAGPELAAAVRAGHVVKWHKWVVYECEPILQSFAAEIAEMRDHYDAMGDSALSSWCKSIAVGLVGKFAQRCREWVWHPERSPHTLWDQYYERADDGRVYRWQEICGVHRRESLSSLGADSVPSVSAWITSAARHRLSLLASVCGRHNTVYMDTDSLYVSEQGFTRLAESGWIRSGEYGYLEHRATYDGMTINGLKSYIAGSNRKDSGLPRGAARVPGVETIIRQNVWASTCLEMGSRPEGLCKVSRWNRIRPYQHGIVTAGGRVEPLRVWED